MTIESAFVLCQHEHLGSGALIGKLVHEATAVDPLLIFGGARQLHESDLMYTVETRIARENPRCVVIAVLEPFEGAPFEGHLPVNGGPPSTFADIAFLLGYLGSRLPKTHVFVIGDDSESGFWIDPEIRVMSPRDRDWRSILADGLSGIGVEVDGAKVLDADS